MTTATELTTVDFTQLPSTNTSDEAFDDAAKGGGFLKRIQLYTKGKAIDKGLISPGHYGVPISDDEIMDLGASVDVMPLARRLKAIDFNDRENIITVYDHESDEYRRIAAAADEKDSGCMFGVSFLVVERTTGKLYEFYCATKSSRPEAKNLYPFLPQGDQPPTPATLATKYVERKFSYHVPVVKKCSTPFDKLPPTPQLVSEVERFVNPPASDVEVVEDAPARAR